MLVTVAATLLAPAACAAGAIAGVPAARRLISNHLFASRLAGALTLTAIGLAAPWLDPVVLAAAAGLTLGFLLWTTKPLRRRWGYPLPRCPVGEWERFERGFRAYADRLERRQRPHSDG